MASIRPALAGVLLSALLAGCAAGGTGSPTPRSATLTVYAAASLKAVLAGAVPSFMTAHPGVTVMVSTDSSAALATKIEQGAAADVFLSADTTNPQKLVDAGLASGAVVPFARNRMALVVPATNPAGIASPADLARPGVKVVAAAAGVPIGAYTAELLANLATLPGYPTGFAAAVEANVVSREDNVGGIVAKVSLGEGDAGIVYATDLAQAGAALVSVPIPETANVLATYGAVVVASSREQDASAAFLAWLTGTEGRAVLGALGFLPPP